MTSVQHTILGLVLVGAAFLFGSYLHREPADAETASISQLQDGSQNPKYVWQGDLPQSPSISLSAQSQNSRIPAVNSDQPTSMPSLRPFAQNQPNDSQRSQQPDLVEANLVPDMSAARIVNENLAFDEPQRPIAEPDFSQFAIEDPVAPIQMVAPPEPMYEATQGELANASKIATPDFGQHFPSEIRVNKNVEASQTDRPQAASQESLFRLRRPNLNAGYRTPQPPRPNSQLENQHGIESESQFASQNLYPIEPAEPYYDPNQAREYQQTSRPSFDSSNSQLNTPLRDRQSANPNGFRPLEPNQNYGQRFENRGESLASQARNSNTVQIRPRNRSPIMSDSARYGTHRTAQGDTLHDLAVKYYGDSAFYLDIYVANQGVLNNPGHVPVGVALKIPIYDQ